MRVKNWFRTLRGAAALKLLKSYQVAIKRRIRRPLLRAVPACVKLLQASSLFKSQGSALHYRLKPDHPTLAICMLTRCLGYVIVKHARECVEKITQTGGLGTLWLCSG